MTKTKEQKREYDRQYRIKNREKKRKYRADHRAEQKERNRKYYLEHTEALIKYATQYNAEHKEEHKVYRQRTYVKHREKELAASRFKSFGITNDEYKEMLSKQEGKCAICGKRQEETERKFSVDHDHQTNKIRGIICNSCNMALGLFGDDIVRLQEAVQYLSKAIDSNL